MTTRANIKITVLQVLDRLPAGYPQRVSALRAEVSLALSPSPRDRQKSRMPSSA